MKCDVSDCDGPVFVVVKFIGQRKAYPYCAHHGTRWDRSRGEATAHARFGRYDRQQRRWITAVGHADYLTTSRRRTR